LVIYLTLNKLGLLGETMSSLEITPRERMVLQVRCQNLPKLIHRIQKRQIAKHLVKEAFLSSIKGFGGRAFNWFTDKAKNQFNTELKSITTDLRKKLNEQGSLNINNPKFKIIPQAQKKVDELFATNSVPSTIQKPFQNSIERFNHWWTAATKQQQDDFLNLLKGTSLHKELSQLPVENGTYSELKSLTNSHAQKYLEALMGFDSKTKRSQKVVDFVSKNIPSGLPHTFKTQEERLFHWLNNLEAKDRQAALQALKGLKIRNINPLITTTAVGLTPTAAVALPFLLSSPSLSEKYKIPYDPSGNTDYTKVYNAKNKVNIPVINQQTGDIIEHLPLEEGDQENYGIHYRAMLDLQNKLKKELEEEGFKGADLVRELNKRIEEGKYSDTTWGLGALRRWLGFKDSFRIKDHRKKMEEAKENMKKYFINAGSSVGGLFALDDIQNKRNELQNILKNPPNAIIAKDAKKELDELEKLYDFDNSGKILKIKQKLTPEQEELLDKFKKMGIPNPLDQLSEEAKKLYAAAPQPGAQQPPAQGTQQPPQPGAQQPPAQGTQPTNVSIPPPPGTQQPPQGYPQGVQQPPQPGVQQPPQPGVQQPPQGYPQGYYLDGRNLEESKNQMTIVIRNNRAIQEGLYNELKAMNRQMANSKSRYIIYDPTNNNKVYVASGFGPGLKYTPDLAGLNNFLVNEDLVDISNMSGDQISDFTIRLLNKLKATIKPNLTDINGNQIGVIADFLNTSKEAQKSIIDSVIREMNNPAQRNIQHQPAPQNKSNTSPGWWGIPKETNEPNFSPVLAIPNI
jgi:hypothetical protein